MIAIEKTLQRLASTNYFFEEYDKKRPLLEKIFLLQAAVVFAKSIVEIFEKETGKTASDYRESWEYSKPLADFRNLWIHEKPLEKNDLGYSFQGTISNLGKILKRRFDENNTEVVIEYEDEEGKVQAERMDVSLFLRKNYPTHKDFPAFLVSECIYYWQITLAKYLRA